MRYFRMSEFRCKDGCGGCEMAPRFLSMIDDARHRAGIPFVVNSGYRCEAHNRAVGSTSTNHTRGVAADIRCNTGPNRLKVVKALVDAGFTRIGLHSGFIHCDINDGVDSMWFY